MSIPKLKGRLAKLERIAGPNDFPDLSFEHLELMTIEELEEIAEGGPRHPALELLSTGDLRRLCEGESVEGFDCEIPPMSPERERRFNIAVGKAVARLRRDGLIPGAPRRRSFH